MCRHARRRARTSRQMHACLHVQRGLYLARRRQHRLPGTPTKSSRSAKAVDRRRGRSRVAIGSCLTPSSWLLSRQEARATLARAAAAAASLITADATSPNVKFAGGGDIARGVHANGWIDGSCEVPRACRAFLSGLRESHLILFLVFLSLIIHARKIYSYKLFLSIFFSILYTLISFHTEYRQMYLTLRKSPNSTNKTDSIKPYFSMDWYWTFNWLKYKCTYIRFLIFFFSISA